MNVATITVGGVSACASDCKPITSGMIGVTVAFEYTDPLWDKLHRTAVFTAGKVTRDVLNADGTVMIPPEVLEHPREWLSVGVYGTDADGNLVIPTLMTQVGYILPGADPSGDEGTNPELPIWAQLQADIEALKQSGPGGGSIVVDEEGYLTTSSGGFDIDDDGYIVL